MRKFTSFVLVLLLSVSCLFAQSVSSVTVDKDPQAPSEKGTENLNGCIDLLAEWPVHSTGGQAGVETDGQYVYVTVWSSTSILKYDSAGNYLSTFSIPGVSGLRDLAYDGQYFYGGNAGSTIYKMDFTNQSLIGSISCGGGAEVRHIAYDPNSDAFWVGNWSTDILLINRSGTPIDTIPAVSSTLPSLYGSAVDTVTPGGPYLWVFSQGGNGCNLGQIDIATGMPTGLIYDLYYQLGIEDGSIGGGLFTHYDPGSNTHVLGGHVQNVSVFIYDLMSLGAKTNDAGIAEVDIDYFNNVNSPVSISGEIHNLGTSIINSADISYSINGATPVTSTLNNLSISSFGTYTFTHPTAWTPSSEGFYDVDVWVALPGSSADEKNCNDTTSATTMVMPANPSQRLVLHEAFTSSTCGPCVNGNITLKGVLDNNPNKWTCVKYQMDWPSPGDPYFNNDGEIRQMYYGVSSVPNMVVDGQWQDNTSNYTSTILNEYYGYGAALDITATHSLGGYAVSVDVGITPLMDYPAGMVLHVAVVENETYNNAGSNGESVFYFVEQKMLPDGHGTVLPAMTTNNTHTETFIADLSNTFVENPNNLSVVVFVQDNSFKLVHNSAWSTEVIGIDENDESASGIAGLFPNPADDNAYLNYVVSEKVNASICITNVLGEEIHTEDLGVLAPGNYTARLDVRDFESGLYFINLLIGERIFSKKLQVK